MSTLHSADYYGKCMMGGVLACGLTHAAVVSLDVAKCRSQAHSKSGAWPAGLVPSLKQIIATEGISGLKVGIVPTFVGYGAQGLFKFGLNEFFKDVYTGIIGKETLDNSKITKMAMWAAASGSAEIFADIALCPFEMVKVKMQVVLPGQTGGVPKSLIPAMQMMAADKSMNFPFGSLKPLWGRQVPYTMIKFVGFYQTAEMVYNYIESSTGKKKSDIPESTQLGITFACGYWAGIFCAVATQPMDNLVSMKGVAANAQKSFGQLAAEMGTKDLFLKGLPVRIIMIGTLTGLQWWVYGSFKSFMGFGTA